MNPIIIVALLGILGVFGIVALIFVTRLLYIAEPNEALIFSGRRAANANYKGYRIVRGGRSFRVPLLETVDRLDLTNMVIEVKVRGAYSKGGIPLNVDGVANVKVAAASPVIDNATERLLGRNREQIVAMSTEVLEGNLRGVLSQLTPEEVNEDKIAFGQQLLHEAMPDLAKLGLVLDTMNIQRVEDERGYLTSIGRVSSADISRQARVDEARARADAKVQEVSALERATLRDLEAREAIARAQCERRVADATTRGQAMVAEAEGRATAEIARAEAALKVEAERVELVRRRLEADVVAPALADMESSMAEADGRAAIILEEGRANASALRDMIKVWKDNGDQARDVYLVQQYQRILAHLVTSLDNVRVDRLTMLPSDSDSVSSTAARLVEELKGSVGVDLTALLPGPSGD